MRGAGAARFSGQRERAGDPAMRFTQPGRKCRVLTDRPLRVFRRRSTGLRRRDGVVLPTAERLRFRVVHLKLLRESHAVLEFPPEAVSGGVQARGGGAVASSGRLLEQVARELGVSTESLRLWCRQRYVEPRRFPGRSFGVALWSTAADHTRHLGRHDMPPSGLKICSHARAGLGVVITRLHRADASPLGSLRSSRDLARADTSAA
jgi:hypothetical protein